MNSDLFSLSYDGNPFAEVIPSWLNDFTLDPLFELRPQFVVVTFLVLTCSIIMKIVKNTDNNVENLSRPLITAFIIALVVAAAPYWMQLAWKGFSEIAKGPLRWSENQKIVTAISAIASFFAAVIPADLNSMSKPTGTSIVSSLFKGLGYALANCAMLVQMMLFILQYVILQICHMLAPIAIAMYAFDSTKDLAQKFILQTLSVMSWIVGFAIVNMVATKMAVFLLPGVAVGTMVAVITDLLKVDIIPSSQPITMFAYVISSVLIGGSAMVPIFMQGLFTSGMAAAGQAFHPSMAGINGINVAKGQAGGMGMMPGPGGSMIPTGSTAGNLAGSFTAPLGSPRSGANNGAKDAALSHNTTGNASVNATANNSSTVNVSSRSSTSAPALNPSASIPSATSTGNMDIDAASARSVGTSGGFASNPINQAAFSHGVDVSEPVPSR